jgi:pimeloyl-ACP methyl ester carboxylesterase
MIANHMVMNLLKLTLVILTSFSLWLLCGCSSKTTAIKTAQYPAKALTSIAFIELGGVKQCLIIRSHNTDNPILLYVHGGPGTPELPLIRHYNSELEKYFTVVYWEQRGTGKSFSKSVINDDFTIGTFINDGYELTNYLLDRFKKEKLILVGHSWGTVICTELALQYPEKYSAYVGIGQIVNMQLGETIGYNFALNEAIRDNNSKAIKELKNSNQPTYLTIENNPNWYKQLKKQRKWLTYYGGVIYNQKDYSVYTKIFMKSPEYSLTDMIKFARGSMFSLKQLWPQIMEINFKDRNINFEVPVFLIQGKHDYNCPTELVIQFFDQITAPEKKLIIFENSAHNPNFEENDRFNNIMVDLLYEQ